MAGCATYLGCWKTLMFLNAGFAIRCGTQCPLTSSNHWQSCERWRPRSWRFGETVGERTLRPGGLAFRHLAEHGSLVFDMRTACPMRNFASAEHCPLCRCTVATNLHAHFFSEEDSKCLLSCLYNKYLDTTAHIPSRSK